MELSAYALERKNVRMLNFACLAASLLLTAGVGAGYVSTPTRHNAPQLVDGIMYYGFSDSDVSPYNNPSSYVAVATDVGLEVSLNGDVGYTDVVNDENYKYFLVEHYAQYSWIFTSVETPDDLINNDDPWPLIVLSHFDNSYTYDLSFFGYDYFYLAFSNSSVYDSAYIYNHYDSVTGLYDYVPAYDGTNVTDAITDGLGAIVPMGGALVTGFDAIALDDGALTPVVTFGFILMGLGISVGIVKKCFNWVTGRHGM